MNWDCKKVANNLIDIIENNIPESQKKAIQDHLAICPQCNLLVKRFAHAWEELSTAEKWTPSERFWPALFAKIQAYEKPQPMWDKIFTGFRNSLRPATVSLILLLGIFFGYYLGNMPQGSMNKSESDSIDTTRSEMAYVDQYLQDFQDFPDGSVSDFFTKYEIPIQEEKP